MTPQEIVDYLHEEHTPYSQMGLEEGKKHLVELIEQSNREAEAAVIASAIIKEVLNTIKSYGNEGISPESKESCCGSCADGRECGGTHICREDIIINSPRYMGPVVMDLPDVSQSPGANFCISCGHHPTRCQCYPHAVPTHTTQF